jgi:hypothetical protein
LRQWESSIAVTFTAIYTNTNVPTPPTDSIIFVSTVNSSNAPIAGIYTTLWQNGVLAQSCFSSCQFVVGNGQTYQVAVADWGNYSFNHWTGGSTGRVLHGCRRKYDLDHFLGIRIRSECGRASITEGSSGIGNPIPARNDSFRALESRNDRR